MAETPFIHGLDLGRAFFTEVGRGVLESLLPPDTWAVGFMGRGSDVLGYDTETSTDHDWGPRFQVFLAEQAFDDIALRLDTLLQERLPDNFRGYPTRQDDVDGHEDGESPHHLVEIHTLRRFSERYLGVDARGALSPRDWLVIPEQRLLELTAGDVFHDPRGELTAFRAGLREYPRDVWLYRMACQWQRLAQEETFAARSAEAGDTLGMRIATARTVRDIMKLCFLVERCYCPYGKWLGSAFSRLRCAPRLGPSLEGALAADGIAQIEIHLAACYCAVAEMHNALGLTGKLETTTRAYRGRTYAVIGAARFANALLGGIQGEEIRGLHLRMGGIDQFIDCTDYIENPATYQRTRGVYW